MLIGHGVLPHNCHAEVRSFRLAELRVVMKLSGLDSCRYHAGAIAGYEHQSRPVGGGLQFRISATWSTRRSFVLA